VSFPLIFLYEIGIGISRRINAKMEEELKEGDKT
jgi:Sec-independent protein secretion pathway component TatC